MVLFRDVSSVLLVLLVTLDAVSVIDSFSPHPSTSTSTLLFRNPTLLPASSPSSAPQTTTTTTTTTTPTPLGSPLCEYHTLTIPTSQPGPPQQAIHVEDLTPQLQQLLQDSGMQQGCVTILSRHTTTAITINERETFLEQDMQTLFWELVPPDERSDCLGATQGRRYRHNDIHQRPASEEEAQRCRDNGWDIDDNPKALQEWRNQEPINAHSHLLSMLIGSSESIPVVNGKMVLGQWQSVMMVDLDGPRDRTVGVQLMGYQ